MPPWVQPMFAMPCCWMPIFDADCQPFMHPGQIQHVPMPPTPGPMPTPSLPAFGIDDETLLEIEGMGPIPIPTQVQSSVPYGWKLLESPEILFEESPTLEMEFPMMEEEFTPIAPMPQMSVGGFHQPAMHHHHQPTMRNCGCGSSSVAPYGCTPAAHCGCGGFHSMPMQMPCKCRVNHCNACNQPLQQTPYHMMPFPHQGHNWYGSY